MRLFYCCWSLLILAILPALPWRSASAAQPATNVVLILADDLGYGELGCYGHPKFRTPHLDRMAQQGVRLTQFHTPMAFCAPTRASLLTGRYPLRCGMTGNPAPDGGPVADALGLPLSEQLLPQLFQKAGYATAMVGKWHLGHKRTEFLPTKRGFDEYLGILYSNDMRPVKLIEGEKTIEYPVVQATLTRRYTDRAVDFLTRHQRKPFFLYFAHAMPHKPLACSEAFYKKSGAGLYGDVLAELDASVGEILSTLQKLNLDKNTLVVFTSDNGPWYGGSTGGLRGMKGTSWEGGYRVPCLLRWPGKLPPGKVSEELGVMMDLFPTLLTAAGIKPPTEIPLDGQNLLPMLSGKARSPHEVIFGHQGNRLATVRDARWKLHVLPARDRREKGDPKKWLDPRGPDGVTILAPYEQHTPADYPGRRGGDETTALSLFDLSRDPGEQRNVAKEHPQVVARLKARYDQAVAELTGKR